MGRKITPDPLNRKLELSDSSKGSILKDMIDFGKMATNNGLIYGNFGNLSVKYSDEIYITRSGAMMGNLKEEDIIIFSGNIPEESSSDSPIHYGIYQKINYGAIMHMHGDFTIVLSLMLKNICPCDFVGNRFLGTIPIVEGEFGTTALTTAITSNIHNNAVIIKGHGSFAIGDDLRKAFVLSCALEASCKLLYYKHIYKSLTSKKEI